MHISEYQELSLQINFNKFSFELPVGRRLGLEEVETSVNVDFCFHRSQISE